VWCGGVWWGGVGYLGEFVNFGVECTLNLS
jgi:hypothetical protein